MARVSTNRVEPTKKRTTIKQPVKPTTSPTKAIKKTDNNEPKEQAIVWYILALVLFFVSIILLIACISFFFTWQEDQSVTFFSSSNSKIHNEALNVCGRFGAVISRIFICDWFGTFGILMPFVLTSFAAYIVAVKKNFIYKTLIVIFSTAIIGSISASYFFTNYEGIFGSSMGGAAGYAMHTFLEDVVGNIGELCIILMLICILVIYISRSIIPSLIKWFIITEGIIKLLYDKFKAKREKRIQEAKIRRQRKAARDLAHRNAASNKETESIVNDTDEQPVASINNLLNSDEQNETEFSQQDNDTDTNYDVPVNTENPVFLTDNEDTEDTFDYEYTETEEEYGEEEEDVQEEYSEQINEFNRSIGVIETEDSFKIEPTIINTNVSHFNAQDTPTEIKKETNDNPNLAMYTDKDVVILDPAFFTDTPIENGTVNDDDSNDFEMFTINPKNKETGEEIEVTEEDTVAGTTINSPIEQTVTTSTDEPINNPIKIEDEGEEFIIERTNTPIEDEDFEVAVTDNANLDLDDEDELSLVKINRSEIFDDKDIDDSLFDPTLSLSMYKRPSIDLMDNHTKKVNVTNEELFDNKNRIIETLNNFNIKIDKIKATIGPTVTLYEIIPAPGVRISKIKNLEDDIALSLSALGIRIIAPIPGKGTIGIEVPNKDKEVVSMYSVIKSVKFQDSDAELPIVLGRTIQNEDYVVDLAKAPHMLVAGATGQGKSVGLNAIITSLLYKKHPAELKFVFVDPKKVELTLYSLLERHFLAKLPDEEEAIITDTQKVVYTLNSMCSLMDTRYDVLKSAKVRNVKEYNDKFKARRLNPNKGHEFMPYFVVIIDEFADLIMTAGREVETPIARLAQLGRATGIHLVIATQRPTTNIITGVIKANFPTRVAFRVSSMIDSRTILDQPGANQLIGRGDMLISNGNDTTRVQCAFIDTPEVERICEFISKQTGFGGAYELPEFIEPSQEKDNENGSNIIRRDGLFTEVARYVVTSQQGSASTIQRNFSIGFNRAGRIMDQLEKAGIVGKQEGSKPRKVLISDIASLEVMLYDMDNAPLNF
ncbi:MAG: DNA translocase FtsK 4TM domain-containing protein [Rikenellaceae bacterium]